MLYMFRTILAHHQEQPFISCTSHLVYAGTSGCCVAITTQQPDVSAYTKCDVQLQNVAPDDGLQSPKHVEHLMINKDTL